MIPKEENDEKIFGIRIVVRSAVAIGLCKRSRHQCPRRLTGGGHWASWEHHMMCLLLRVEGGKRRDFLWSKKNVISTLTSITSVVTGCTFKGPQQISPPMS